MKNYLKKNYKYWNFDYDSKNVESAIFRLINILELFYINKNSSFLDFGCGQGASVNYLINKKYKAVGVDISKKNIEIGNKFFKFDQLYTVPIDSFNCDFTKYNNNNKFDVILCQQSIYYFSEGHFKKLLDNFYNALDKNGILYFSAISTKHTLFKKAKAHAQDWLYSHKFNYKKGNALNHTFFVSHAKKFYKKYLSKFKLLHIGEYFMQLSNKTTNNHHYTFILQK
jgi:cyclopropane fatty-acyl-phospholipid synthase-like methyltransferase